MMVQTASFKRLRWLASVLFGLLWATLGCAATLAERGDFGHATLAAKSVDFVKNTGTLGGKLATTRQLNAAQRELGEMGISLNRRYTGNGGAFDWGDAPAVSLMKHPTEFSFSTK
jgi:hypothetical protein